MTNKMREGGENFNNNHLCPLHVWEEYQRAMSAEFKYWGSFNHRCIYSSPGNNENWAPVKETSAIAWVYPSRELTETQGHWSELEEADLIKAFTDDELTSLFGGSPIEFTTDATRKMSISLNPADIHGVEFVMSNADNEELCIDLKDSNFDLIQRICSCPDCAKENGGHYEREWRSGTVVQTYHAFILAPDTNTQRQINHLYNDYYDYIYRDYEWEDAQISAIPWEDVAVIDIEFFAGNTKWVGINLYGANIRVPEPVAESSVVGFSADGMQIALHSRHVLGKEEHKEISPWVTPDGYEDIIKNTAEDAGFTSCEEGEDAANHWCKTIPVADLTFDAETSSYTWCWVFQHSNAEDVEDDRIYNEKFTNEFCFTAQIDLNPVTVESDGQHTVQDKIDTHSKIPGALLISPTYTLKVEESKKLGERVRIYIDMDQAFPLFDVRAKTCMVKCIDAHCDGEDAVILGSDGNYCVWSFLNFETIQTDTAVRAIYEWDAFKFDSASPEAAETHTISCVMEHAPKGTLPEVTYDACLDL